MRMPTRLTSVTPPRFGDRFYNQITPYCSPRDASLGTAMVIVAITYLAGGDLGPAGTHRCPTGEVIGGVSGRSYEGTMDDRGRVRVDGHGEGGCRGVDGLDLAVDCRPRVDMIDDVDAGQRVGAGGARDTKQSDPDASCWRGHGRSTRGRIGRARRGGDHGRDRRHREEASRQSDEALSGPSDPARSQLVRPRSE